MKKIVLLCAAGMSTSVLVSNMRKEAKEQNYMCEIDAFALDSLSKVGNEADCILLGPQVSHNLENVIAEVTCPVEVIDMRTYGMMDGKNALALAQTLLGDV